MSSTSKGTGNDKKAKESPKKSYRRSGVAVYFFMNAKEYTKFLQSYLTDKSSQHTTPSLWSRDILRKRMVEIEKQGLKEIPADWKKQIEEKRRVTFAASKPRKKKTETKVTVQKEDGSPKELDVPKKDFTSLKIIKKEEKPKEPKEEKEKPVRAKLGFLGL